jgi:hypothetical protein
MANYAPAQLAEWEAEGGQRLDYNRGLIQVYGEAEHEHLINLPNRFVRRSFPCNWILLGNYLEESFNGGLFVLTAFVTECSLHSAFSCHCFFLLKYLEFDWAVVALGIELLAFVVNFFFVRWEFLCNGSVPPVVNSLSF